MECYKCFRKLNSKLRFKVFQKTAFNLFTFCPQLQHINYKIAQQEEKQIYSLQNNLSTLVYDLQCHPNLSLTTNRNDQYLIDLPGSSLGLGADVGFPPPPLSLLYCHIHHNHYYLCQFVLNLKTKKKSTLINILKSSTHIHISCISENVLGPRPFFWTKTHPAFGPEKSLGLDNF